VLISSKSQIFAIPSISDSTYSENHKYLIFATGFLTLGGNLLQGNRFFFDLCLQHTNTNEIWECSSVKSCPTLVPPKEKEIISCSEHIRSAISRRLPTNR